MMTTDEARKMLALIRESATELRAVGVRRVDLGGVAFELAPGEPEPQRRDDDDEDKAGAAPTDVLRDPWTRGVPGKDAAGAITASRKRRPL